MKNYPALLASFDQLGKVKDLSVQRQDRRGEINEETAPADISIQVYSQPNIVSEETGLFATTPPHPGPRSLRLDVELAHDRCGDCVPCAVGLRPRASRLDREAHLADARCAAREINQVE